MEEKVGLDRLLNTYGAMPAG